MEVYTIGFAGRTAEDFFGALRRQAIRRLVDVRLNNTSQLAGFTKRQDLPFFLKELCSAEYVHELLLAPTPELLTNYRKRRLTWFQYEQGFHQLLRKRQVQDKIDPRLLQGPTVLLCSEMSPERCHRRLVLEYLQSAWGDLSIRHL